VSRPADAHVTLSVHSLVGASTAFGGAPRQWLFDDPKTVVLERVGTAIRFHPVLLGLCAQMWVEPSLCAVARPDHKGPRYTACTLGMLPKQTAIHRREGAAPG